MDSKNPELLRLLGALKIDPNRCLRHTVALVPDVQRVGN